MISIASVCRFALPAPFLSTLATLSALLICSLPAASEPVPVRYQEGTLRAFLVLRNQEGRTLASGQLLKIVHGDRVTARLLFHFRDGSLDDETSVYSQRSSFHLISDHHIQKGPAYSHDIDFHIDVPSGQVSLISTDPHGKQTSDESHLDLPADLANGMVVPLLMNLRPGPAPTSVSYLAPLAKPRLIHLDISVSGHKPLTIGGLHLSATEFLVKPVLGGLAGVVAPMLGKEPADAHLWIIDGAAPTFIKEEGQFFEGGPIWSIEQASPSTFH